MDRDDWVGAYVHSRGWSRESIKSEWESLNHLKRLASIVCLCGTLRNPSWELVQNASITTLSTEEALGVALQCIQDLVKLRKSRRGSEVNAGKPTLKHTQMSLRACLVISCKSFGTHSGGIWTMAGPLPK